MTEGEIGTKPLFAQAERGVPLRDCVDLVCVHRIVRGLHTYELHDCAVFYGETSQSHKTPGTLDHGQEVRRNVDPTLSKQRAAPDGEVGHVHERAGLW